MKKKIIITVIFMILTINIPSMSQVSTNDVISTIENNFWGYDYSNESDTKRLERIENHLYGEKKSGNIQKRLENIQNDTGITVVEKPPQSVSKEDLKNNKTVQKTPEIPQNLKEDSSVEYPIVDKMEEEILHTTYKNENIYNRLNRLEEKVFNKTSNEDLSTRVNKLASAIAPAQKNYQNQNYSNQNQDNYYNNNGGYNSFDDTAMPFQIAVIEEDLLRKSYVDDNISNRLGRLEQKLFNRTFTNDTDVTRLQRIMVAYEAKKNSYKYENNRKMQNMATFSQIGGLLLMILAILL